MPCAWVVMYVVLFLSRGVLAVYLRTQVEAHLLLGACQGWYDHVICSWAMHYDFCLDWTVLDAGK